MGATARRLTGVAPHLPAALAFALGVLAGCAAGPAAEAPAPRPPPLPFVDAHVHFAQVDVIASPADGLLQWLERRRSYR